GGHLARAHELTQQAVQSALAVGNKEQAAVWLLNAAWREQLFGNLQRAHDDALRALKIAPNSREGEAVAAILLARMGDFAKSKVLDNPCIVQLSATAPMARLQLARSYVSQAALGDSSARAKARAAYKEFLALWQDADVGIHVLTEARSEYSKLQ